MVSAIAGFVVATVAWMSVTHCSALERNDGSGDQQDDLPLDRFSVRRESRMTRSFAASAGES